MVLIWFEVSGGLYPVENTGEDIEHPQIVRVEQKTDYYLSKQERIDKARAFALRYHPARVALAYPEIRQAMRSLFKKPRKPKIEKIVPPTMYEIAMAKLFGSVKVVEK